MQVDTCNILCFVKWPKVTDNFNPTYQMKMVMMILPLPNFVSLHWTCMDHLKSQPYLQYQMQNNSVAVYKIIHLTSEIWHNYVCEYNYIHPNTDWHTYTTHGREHASIHIQTCTYLISFAHRHTHTKTHVQAQTCIYT